MITGLLLARQVERIESVVYVCSTRWLAPP